jgi:hypothetical protein
MIQQLMSSLKLTPFANQKRSLVELFTQTTLMDGKAFYLQAVGVKQKMNKLVV